MTVLLLTTSLVHLLTFVFAKIGPFALNHVHYLDKVSLSYRVHLWLLVYGVLDQFK